MAGDDNSRTNRPMRRGDGMQRAAEGWHLRVIGRTWQQIADELGYANPSNAYRAVMRFAGTVPDPQPNTLRELWRARMERLWTIAQRDAEASRPGALRAGVAVAQRAAQLDGLDAPSRVVVTPEDAELERIVARLLERGGQVDVVEAEVLELEQLPDDATD
ncbi:hypothetical protein GH740_11510 [Microbacterium sp. SYP-A9085]|uniref:hypothetical protein n=1 Tax=Microbacterium sp. SYP-A9085 TaxID=2664454 RepID=UPI00129A496B|nr:hypothetical protein [Microbacterium sp. SYP-A9085]MRH29929.1 hypothetical protein [Microbacterium sp. SYP-A9085]